jgi:hypothetical protein
MAPPRARELEAVAIREAAIEDDDVRSPSFDDLERLRQRAGRRHVEPLVPERLFVDVACVRVVLDEEHVTSSPTGPRRSDHPE